MKLLSDICNDCLGKPSLTEVEVVHEEVGHEGACSQWQVVHIACCHQVSVVVGAED